MTLVLDASFVVAALIDAGPVGEWADSLLLADHLLAPHVMPAEVANVLRKASASAALSADLASLAHRDLERLRVELLAYSPFAERIWELRANLTTYDAWYVSVAEAFDATLVTLDRRIARAPGLRCPVATPPQ